MQSDGPMQLAHFPILPYESRQGDNINNKRYAPNSGLQSWILSGSVWQSGGMSHSLMD